MIHRKDIARARGQRRGRRAALLGLPLLLAAGSGPAIAGQLFNNTNIYAVNNGPPKPAIVSLAVTQVSQITTYHWNGGQGATPGTITLRDSTCHDYGPFRVHTSSGQGNAPNVNWIADVNLRMPAGNYLVVDSSPATWSYNAQSHDWGFTTVSGTVLANAPVDWTPYPTRCLTSSAGPAAGNGGGAIPVSFPSQPSPTPTLQACPNSGGSNPYMLNPVCQGPTGTVITLVVSQRLPAAISGVTFGPGPIGSGRYGGRGVLMAVPANTLFKAPIPVSIPANAPVGSRYSVAVPPGLCLSRGTNWAWDVWLLHPGGARQGDVGTFVATGC